MVDYKRLTQKVRYYIMYDIKRIHRDIPSFIGNFVGRMRRGWGPRDVWSLDTYLAGVIGGSLIHLAETTHGYSYRYSSAETWKSDLRKYGNDLLKYSNIFNISEIEEEKEVSRAGIEAIRWVAANFESLWD